jgi:hypothetical protein
MRKTACHRSDDRNAMPAKIPDCARRRGSDNRYERARHSRRKAAKQKESPHDYGGNGQGRRMHFLQSSTNFSQLQDCSASGNVHTQHFSKYRDSYLEPNSGEKAIEHRLREKVGDEAQFEQSRQQQEPSRE